MKAADYVYVKGLDGATVRTFEPQGRPLVIVQARTNADDANIQRVGREFEARAISGGGPIPFDVLFLPSRYTYEIVGAREAPEVVDAPSDAIVVRPTR